MFAELHLAEDTFALHLLFQRLEGLVDIVVSDENLHVVSSLIHLLIDPTAKEWAAGAQICAKAADIR
jgi:hypothetical protein